MAELPPIPFLDLKPRDSEEDRAVAAAVQRVVASGWYLMGPELAAFEREFANYLSKHTTIPPEGVVGVASGTDALTLALRALAETWQVQGTAAVVPALTCVPTIAAVRAAGLRPVLCDVDTDTLLMSAITLAAATTPECRFVVPVHLYGNPCGIPDPCTRTLEDGAFPLVVQDCAQAHGAQWNNFVCGALGDLSAFSFYPTKNLGALGDAGAVVDPAGSNYAPIVRQLQNYGEERRYHSVREGVNGRMDEIQAAVLRARLPFLDANNARRAAIAARYNAAFSGSALRLTQIGLPEYSTHAWHLYVVRHPERDRLKAFLAERGIGTMIHYPTPLHLQPAYRFLGYATGDFPAAEAACRTVLSLPLHPRLREDEADRVIESVLAFLKT